jgi:hypothetical protein
MEARTRLGSLNAGSQCGDAKFAVFHAQGNPITNVHPQRLPDSCRDDDPPLFANLTSCLNFHVSPRSLSNTKVGVVSSAISKASKTTSFKLCGLASLGAQPIRKAHSRRHKFPNILLRAPKSFPHRRNPRFAAHHSQIQYIPILHPHRLAHRRGNDKPALFPNPYGVRPSGANDRSANRFIS